MKDVKTKPPRQRLPRDKKSHPNDLNPSNAAEFEREGMGVAPKE